MIIYEIVLTKLSKTSKLKTVKNFSYKEELFKKSQYFDTII